MLTFYFSKGSSALAAHILLIETGTAFTATEISIPNGDHRNTAFLRRNPKGRIPVLDTPDGLLTENPAILEYIAATHPEAGLLPKGPYPQARARALCAYLCATAHVAFAHLHRGARWASKEASLDDMRARVPDNLADCAAHLETDLPFSPGLWGPPLPSAIPISSSSPAGWKAQASTLPPTPNLPNTAPQCAHVRPCNRP
ncbi:glutathione S-transferase family protein [Sulfitobacter aestuariivivens]|uniref:glutathione S-transferase family protein n=1 Tax=Sulfitobacter aestuariivivens TaxID=2766981 RepID=UPI00361C851C